MVICDCHTHNGCFHPIYGGLAQSVEHFFCKERVRGSIPLASTGCHYVWRSAAVRRQCLHSSVWSERVLAMYEAVGSNPTGDSSAALSVAVRVAPHFLCSMTRCGAAGVCCHKRATMV